MGITMTSSHILKTHSSLNCGWVMDRFGHLVLNLPSAPWSWSSATNWFNGHVSGYWCGRYSSRLDAITAVFKFDE